MRPSLIDALKHKLQLLDAQGLRRQRRTIGSPCGPHLHTGGVSLLAFCSNDYLGLAADPRVVESLREGALRYGAGSGASHLISGHSQAHALLEERLAAFMQPEIADAAALYFCTGYMANLAVLSALADRETTLFCEALNHASLIDGARLSRAAVEIYPHHGIEQLAALLHASTAANKIVVTDSVFSMDGDLANLPAILALCDLHDAWLLVDDAHGFGVLGQHGRGALEHFALSSPRIIYMGTLGKAAGVGGAFVAAHRTVIEWLIQRARPYIYSTAAAPALAHALLTSLDIIDSAEGSAKRLHLHTLIAHFQAGLSLQRWHRAPSSTPIQPVIIGANETTMALASALHDDGIWVGAIRPPTVAAGTARLRIALSAAHTVADVDRLTARLNFHDQQGLP